MEEFNYFTTAIVAIITGIITACKMYTSPTRKRLMEYHSRVLLPFMVDYKKDQDRNWKKYINNIVSYKDDFVPPYIYYLVEKKNDKDLVKVLLNDVYEYYNNERNRFNFYFNITFNLIWKVLYIASIITSATSILVAIMDMIFFAIKIVEQLCKYKSFVFWESINGVSSLLEIGLCILVALIGVLLSKLIFKRLIDDVYTCKLSRMDRIIKKKKRYVNKYIKAYNKNLNLKE